MRRRLRDLALIYAAAAAGLGIVAYRLDHICDGQAGCMVLWTTP